MIDTPISRVIDDLLNTRTPATDWLERAGPIARRMLEESENDPEEEE